MPKSVTSSAAELVRPVTAGRQIGNALVNYAGGVVALGSMLAFQVAYSHMVSAEVFGLISLLFTVTLVLPAFDFGVGRTVGRILAERLPDLDVADQLRTDVLTLQVINGAIGILLGGALALAAEWISVGWLRPVDLGVAEVAAAVVLVGANVPWLMARQFITACFNAMQRQALANALLVAFVVLRGGAGILTLSGPNPVVTFLVFQLSVNFLDVLVGMGILWGLIPGPRGLPRLNFSVVRQWWRFAAGDGATSFIGVATMHMDKVLLSALLPLSVYGAYALIATVATGIGRIAGPTAVAFLPYFVELYTSGRHRQLTGNYLLATQLSACIVFPVAAVLVVFAPDIVPALLLNAPLGGELAMVFALLVVASTLANLMQLPHAIQLAMGNSMIALRFGAMNALTYLILVIVLTPRLGVLSPALSLLGVYGISMCFFVHATHRAVRVSTRRWLWEGTGRVALASIGIALAVAWLVPRGIGQLWGSCALLGSMAAASGAALGLTPGAWGAVLDFVRQARGRTKTAVVGR